MKDRDLEKILSVLPLLVGVMFALVIAIPLFAGITFGQRCHRMHPSDPIAAERCVYDLSKGIRP